jgi:peptidyl-prolyl cis-trans isomerase D
MQAFREMVRGWLGKTLLTVVTVGMAGLGIGSYFANDNKPVVAEVNGKKIYKTEFDKNYENERQQMLQHMGPNADVTTIDVKKLRTKVLKDLVNKELIDQAAQDNGFLVSDAFFTKWQQSQQAFLEDGKFSQQRYISALQQSGHDPVTFPEYFKSQMAATALLGSLGQTSFGLRHDVMLLASLDAEKRDLHLATVDAANYAAVQTAGDAEIKAYYDTHPKTFTAQERVALDYITLSRDDFLPQATVTDDDLQARYADRIKNISESRHSQHILITVDAKTTDAAALKKIQDIEKRARAGEDFGTLAKEYSQDPGSVSSGGDLGFYSKGGGFDPKFEQAMFALTVGEISPPVRSAYGYHLIKLLEVRKPDVPSFDSLKADIEKEAKAAKADELYSEAVEKLDTAVYEAPDLKDPAGNLKLVVQSTEPFSRSGLPGSSVGSNRSVLNVAFSDDLIKEGKNSQAIRIDDTHTVWVRVKSHEAERVEPLAEVLGQARGLVILDKATAKAKSVADAAAKDLNAGKALADVAATYQLHWDDKPGADHHAQGLTPDQIKVAFRLPKPADGKVSAEAVPGIVGGSFVVVATSKVIAGATAIPDLEIAQMTGVVGENIAQFELQDYVQYLREHASIKTYDIKDDTSAQ